MTLTKQERIESLREAMKGYETEMRMAERYAQKLESQIADLTERLAEARRAADEREMALIDSEAEIERLEEDDDVELPLAARKMWA